MSAPIKPAAAKAVPGKTEAAKPKSTQPPSEADSSDSDSDSPDSESDSSDPDSPVLEQGRERHYLESETIKIIVGKKTKQRKFFVHDGLITNSKFFKACLDSGFKEGTTSTVTLEEDYPKAVEHFIKWLYLGKMSEFTFDISWNFARLYRFADMICDEGYCNDLMDARRAYDRTRNSYQTFKKISFLYDLGLRHTPYAKYAMKSLVQEMLTNPQHFASQNDPAINTEDTVIVFQDMVKEIIEYQTTPYDYPDTLEGCHFHSHEAGSMCSAMKATKAAETGEARDTDTQHV